MTAAPALDAPASERVLFGASELDKVKPGWFREVDLDRLSMRDGFACILGQLFGDFDFGADELMWGLDDCTRRGFYVEGDFETAYPKYDELDELWKTQIGARLLLDVLRASD